jgi:hypothetical protein
MPNEPQIFTIKCKGHDHDIVLTANGELIPLDHDIKEEVTAQAMGSEEPDCMVFYRYFTLEDFGEDPFALYLLMKDAAAMGDFGRMELLSALGGDFSAEVGDLLKDAAWHGQRAMVQHLLEIGGARWTGNERRHFHEAEEAASRRHHPEVCKVFQEWRREHDF